MGLHNKDFCNILNNFRKHKASTLALQDRMYSQWMAIQRTFDANIFFKRYVNVDVNANMSLFVWKSAHVSWLNGAVSGKMLRIWNQRLSKESQIHIFINWIHFYWVPWIYRCIIEIFYNMSLWFNGFWYNHTANGNNIGCVFVHIFHFIFLIKALTAPLHD